MTPNGAPPPGGASRPLQLAAGLAAGFGIDLLAMLLGPLGVSIGTASDVGAMLALAAVVFTLLCLKLHWAVAGLALGMVAGYVVLPRLFGFDIPGVL